MPPRNSVLTPDLGLGRALYGRAPTMLARLRGRVKSRGTDKSRPSARKTPEIVKYI